MPLTQIHSNSDRLHEVEIYDYDDNNSVINKLPKLLRDKLTTRRKDLEEYLSLDEYEAKKTLTITPALNRLRFSFWNEYFMCVENKRQMTMVSMYGGVCSREQFNKMIMSNDKLAWMLRPPVDTVLAMRETLHFGLDRVREILSLSLYKKESIRISETEWEVNEVVNDKAANLMLKAVAMVDLRLHGNYTQVQKIEQKVESKNINVTKHVENIADATYVDVDAEIAKLKLEVTDDIRKLAKPVTATECRDLSDLGHDGGLALSKNPTVVKALRKDIVRETNDVDGDMELLDF